MGHPANKILVAGSTNMDMVVSTAGFPAPGETVIGEGFFMNFGGKGANQAVAAARLGGDVIFLAKTGHDLFGKQMAENLKNENINIDHVRSDPGEASGVALITVDRKGENTIVVAPGANATLKPGDVNDLMHEIDEIGVILMQLETPLDTVAYLAELGKMKNKTVILNPAPAQKLPASLLKNITVITPNQTEAQLLTGIAVHDEKTAFEAAKALREKGPETVIITLGSKGAFYSTGTETGHIPAPAANVVDTTAAGDTFNGALAVMLAEGKTLTEAVAFANLAAARSTEKAGAQRSIPYRKDIMNNNT